MLDRLEADLKTALLARDLPRAQVLRTALTACRKQAQAAGAGLTEVLSEQDAFTVIRCLVGLLEEQAQHAAAVGTGNGPALDLAQVAVLKEYLPQEPPSRPGALQDPRRFDRRLNVGPDFTLKFFLYDEEFQGVPIINLSGGGCCVQLGAELAEMIGKGSRLHNLTLCHPELPATPQLAEVMYLMGKTANLRNQGPRKGVILCGLKFLHATPEFREDLSRYVDAKLSAEVEPLGPETVAALDGGCTSRFFLANQEFHGIRITNLSAGGCCLILDSELAELLKEGTRLHNLSLNAPHLPDAPQHAEVMYLNQRERAFSNRGGRGEPVLAGVRFLNPAREFQEKVSHYVRERMRGPELAATTPYPWKGAGLR